MRRLLFTVILLLCARSASAQMALPDLCVNSPANVGAGQTVTVSDGDYNCLGIHGTVVVTGKMNVVTAQVYGDGFLDIREGAEVVIKNVAPTDVDQFGTGILVEGRIRIAGAVKTGHVRFATEPSGTTLTLASVPSGWKIGDWVFVPDTRIVSEADRWNAAMVYQHERRQITAISGATVTVNQPLAYPHRGARNADGAPTPGWLPHLANMTRSTIVRSANPSGTRGHILATGRASVEIRNAEFIDLGRTTTDALAPGVNQIGRYPLHIHMLMGPVNATNTGYQFQLTGNSIHDTLKWPIAIHGSHYGLIEDNVIIGGSNLAGAGIATEDGSETENLFRRNFVADIRGNINARDDHPDTSRPGTGGECFWLHGFNNRFVENVVAGCRNPAQQIVAGVGFKFIVEPPPSANNRVNPKFRGANMSDPTQTVSVNAQRQAILQFDGNECYALMADCFTIWNIGTDGYAINASQPESLLRNTRIWNTYEGGFWFYPSVNMTVENVSMRYDASPSSGILYHPVAIISGDYRQVNFKLRGADLHVGGVWSGQDPVGTFLFENVNATTRGHAYGFRTPATPGTGASHAGQSVTMNIVRGRITAWPGQPLRTINMEHNTAQVPNDTTSSYVVNVDDYQGTAGDDFRVCYSVQATQNLYGGTCPTGTPRAEIAGLVSGGGTPPPPQEVCGDGVDNDSDGQIDEGCAPPPQEICGDGVDNDGDGQIDEDCPPPTDPNWTFCANEGANCVFTGARTVRYGANATYVTRVLTNGTPCTNAVFGDPIQNVAKHCDLAVVIPPPPQEVCGDGIDNDGDGQVDEGCAPPPQEICGNGLDDDNDGQIDEGCPPPTPIVALEVKNGSCRPTVRPLGEQPPDTTGGWRVEFFMDGVRFGKVDATAPFQQTVEIPTGSHTFTATWTKSGRQPINVPAVVFVCPQR